MKVASSELALHSGSLVTTLNLKRIYITSSLNTIVKMVFGTTDILSSQAFQRCMQMMALTNYLAKH